MQKVVHAAVSVCLFSVIRILPISVASNFAAFAFKPLARIFFKVNVIDANLRLAFPEIEKSSRRKIALELVSNFGRSIVEIINLPKFASGANGTKIAAKGHLGLPFSENNQAIYVSAHLGNWELLPLIFASQPRKLNIIYTTLNHAAVHKKLMSLRRLTGSSYIEKSGALRSCISAMRNGESVAMLIDQRVERGIMAKFFGRETRFTRLPARLSLKFGRPIIFVEAIRVSSRAHDFYFHEPIWPNGSDCPSIEQQMTQEIVSQIERAIRRRPADWFCNKRRWKREKKADEATESSLAVAT